MLCSVFGTCCLTCLKAQVQAAGDTMLGTNPQLAKNFFAPIKDIFDNFAYINLVNVEGVITDKNYSKKCTSGPHCFVFPMPSKMATILAENHIEIANLANNHSMDLGLSGQNDSVDNLISAGVNPIGIPGTYSEKIMKLGQHEYVFIGASPHHHTLSIFDKETLSQLIKKHKKEGRIVIVTAHLGAEGENAYHVNNKEEYFLGYDRGNPIEITHFLIDSGADLFIGHGPHVMRPMEIYKNHLIVYSLGNFLTYGTFDLKGNSGLGGIIRVNLNDDGTFKEGQFFGFQQTKYLNPIAWSKGVALEKSENALNFLKKLTEDYKPKVFQWFEDGRFTIKTP